LNIYCFYQIPTIESTKITERGKSKMRLISSQKIQRKTNILRHRKGFGTVEIVLIIAVLISLALLFRTAITSYATDLITNVFGDQSILSESKAGD
jgi:hypothetical protein